VVGSLAGQELKGSRLVLWPAQHSVEEALGALSVGVNWSGHEGGTSTPSGAKLYLSSTEVLLWYARG
jgi:hypothetical protein